MCHKRAVLSFATVSSWDPFALCMRSFFLGVDPDSTEATLRVAAADAVRAASFVPKGLVYDEYRALCLRVGAYLASEVRSREVGAGVEPAGSTESGRYAVALWTAALAHEPADNAGAVREGLARSCLADGRLDDARRWADEVWALRRADPDFIYGYACLMSRTGKLDPALEFLARAIGKGFPDVPHVRADPDLEALRRAKPEQFAALTSVKWSWDVKWGILNDDVVLKNDSRFALTNVVLDARLEQDQRVWTPRLEAERIPAGQSHTWSGCVSIPGSRLTKATAVLSCDQGP
jgi:hypothetical protein